MRVLVTGGSGFIGRHLVRALAQRGDEVISFDLQRPPEGDVAQHLIGDVLDTGVLNQALQDLRPDAVVHLAARTDLDERAVLANYAANTDGVRNLIAAIQSTPTVRRAIFTSSQLVCRVGYVPTRDDEYSPDTMYGRSKVEGERIVRAAAGGGVEWCIVRPTTIWGPGMRDHYRRFLAMIQSGRYVHVGARPRYKSYGYVGNVVYQYAKLLEVDRGAIAGRTLYLADYEPISLRIWADAFQRELGAPPIRTIPEFVARGVARVGDVVNKLGWREFPFNTFRLRNVLTEYVFDLESTASICGPLPYSMEEGVARTVAWMRPTSSSAVPSVSAS